MKNFEKALQKYYQELKIPEKNYQHIHTKILKSYKRKYYQNLWLSVWSWKRWLVGSPLLAGFAFYLLQGVLQPSPVVAGKLEATYGPVEVIRGEASFLVQDPINIYVGDQVRVRSNGAAILKLPNQAISEIAPSTTLKINELDSLYLAQGKINQQALRGLNVYTDRGIVRSQPGSQYAIEVGETGETRVATLDKAVQVFDLFDGEQMVPSGQELALRSDTRLNGASLSVFQEQNEADVAALLNITRSKLVEGLKHLTNGQKSQAEKHFISAQKSYLSLAEISLTKREFLIREKSLRQQQAFDEVIEALRDKNISTQTVAEALAVKHVLEIIRDQRYNLGFGPANTDVVEYDRLVLISQVLSLDPTIKQQFYDVFVRSYAENFLRRIDNEPLKLDQMVLLKQELERLPQNRTSKVFLQTVLDLSSGSLQEALKEQFDLLF